MRAASVSRHKIKCDDLGSEGEIVFYDRLVAHFSEGGS